MKKLGWFFFIFFAIGVGLYPIMYFLVSENVGLLTQQSPELLERAEREIIGRFVGAGATFGAKPEIMFHGSLPRQ